MNNKGIVNAPEIEKKEVEEEQEQKLERDEEEEEDTPGGYWDFGANPPNVGAANGDDAQAKNNESEKKEVPVVPV